MLVKRFLMSRSAARTPARVSFAVRLQSLLDSKGWSARQLARIAGLASESHVGHLLKGKDPRLTTVIAIAHAADVTVGWLADGEGAPAPKQRDARSTAVALAREARLDARAIELVLAQREDASRSAVSWLDEIRLTAMMMESVPARRAPAKR